MQIKRFKFHPFWKTTYWGFLPYAFRIQLGCDEWHNKSKSIVIPLVGHFIWFEKGYFTKGSQHIYAYDRDGWQGSFYAYCDICDEIMKEFREEAKNN